MSIKDDAVRWAATRYLRGKIKNVRRDGMKTTVGKVLHALDGWKLIIGVVLVAGTKAWDMGHNGHTGDYIGIVLQLLGWTPSADWGTAAITAAGPILVLAGVIGKLVKAQTQINAGVPLADLLTNKGAVTQYINTGKE